MKILALCLNIQDLQERPEDLSNSRRYPGSGWLPHLTRLARARGYEVMGAKQARTRNPRDVVLLQEDFNQDGIVLISQGAKPGLVFCLESKMYVPWFYDNLHEVRGLFRHQLLFEGGSEQLYFPCVDAADLDKPRTPWSERKKRICMIASNKQWWGMPGNFASPAFSSAIRNELHSERLRAIDENEDLDLYGPGWDNLDNLPPHWAHLKPKIARQWKGPCEDKIATLEQYQFSVCHENTAQPGYITEKQVDCVIAGTKPLYLGPKAFSLTEFDPIIQRRDLEKHTYQAFAETVMRLIDGDRFDEGFSG